SEMVFFDDAEVVHLKPFTLTRPAALIRTGILTIAEKWQFELPGLTHSFRTSNVLEAEFGSESKGTEDKLYINGRLLPDENLIKSIQSLNPNSVLKKGDLTLAAVLPAIDAKAEQVEYQEEPVLLSRIHQIFTFNHAEIESDFARITKGRISGRLNESNRVFGKYPLFVEEGVKAESAIINTNEGPVYLGKNSEIMEGACIRGPFALCESSQVKMGAKIYTGTTIGLISKVGGE